MFLFGLPRLPGLQAGGLILLPKRTSSIRNIMTKYYVGKRFGKDDEKYQIELFDFPRYTKFGRII